MVVVFLAWPLLSLFYFSLRRTPLTGESEFVGLANYLLFFNESRFQQNFTHSLQYVVGVLLFSLPPAYLAAVVIMGNPRIGKFFRTLFLFPWVMAPVATAVIFRSMLDPNFGPLQVAKAFGSRAPILLNDPNLAMLSVILHSAWRSFPLEMLFISAGIASISQEMYEAARVDGAGPWTQFLRITLPLTRAQLLVSALTITVYTLQDAEGAYSLTMGGPGYATEVVGVRLFREAFQYFNLGFASAIGTILIVVSVVFMAFYLRLIGEGERA